MTGQTNAPDRLWSIVLAGGPFIQRWLGGPYVAGVSYDSWKDRCSNEHSENTSNRKKSKARKRRHLWKPYFTP